MAKTYDIGDQVKAEVTFTNISKALADPTTVVLKTRDTAGTETSYTYGVDAEVIKSGTGVYYMTIITTAKGSYFYRGVGTGAVVAAGESFFNIRASKFDSP